MMPANLWGNVGRGYTSFGRGAVLAQSKGQFSDCMWESHSSGWVSSLLCQQGYDEDGILASKPQS